MPGPRGDLMLRLYRPSSITRLPLMLFLHGGGWAFGSLQSHEPLCRAYANALQAAIVAVEYGLAPEHPFPEGLEDCHAACCWVRSSRPGPVQDCPALAKPELARGMTCGVANGCSRQQRCMPAQVYEHAGELGGAAETLAVAGDSSGGNLAAAVTLLARQRGTPLIRFQLLTAPVRPLISLLAQQPAALMQHVFSSAAANHADPGKPCSGPALLQRMRDCIPQPHGNAGPVCALRA